MQFLLLGYVLCEAEEIKYTHARFCGEEEGREMELREPGNSLEFVLV